MPRKPKTTLKNVTKAVEELKLSSKPITATASGTIINNEENQQLISEWPKLKNKVPDIFLHKPEDIIQHIFRILSLHIKMYKPYLSRYYTKIKCATMSDYRAMIKLFNELQLAYNTFGQASKRKMKVVIRGLPKDIDLNKLKQELKLLSIPIVRVHIMQIPVIRKQNTILLLAVVPYNDDGKKLLRVQKILGHPVTMEPPQPKIKQCYRCQLWGHTQRYCHGKIRCVKCAGEHISKNCGRDPTKEPPKCVNCDGKHTANYKQCPSCPDSEKHVLSQYLKNEQVVFYGKSEIVTYHNVDALYKNYVY